MERTGKRLFTTHGKRTYGKTRRERKEQARHARRRTKGRSDDIRVEHTTRQAAKKGKEGRGGVREAPIMVGSLVGRGKGRPWCGRALHCQKRLEAGAQEPRKRKRKEGGRAKTSGWNYGGGPAPAYKMGRFGAGVGSHEGKLGGRGERQGCCNWERARVGRRARVQRVFLASRGCLC